MGGDDDQTNSVFRVWVRLLSDFLRHVSLCDRVYRELRRAANPGRCARRAGRGSCPDRCGAAGALRFSTQPHGAPLVQRMVDTHGAAAARAFDVCFVLEPGVDSPFLTMATDRWRGLVC